MKIKSLSYPRLLALGFGIIILVGTGLLCLPLASRSGSWSPLTDCLLTATSATCVTGLISFDTFTHWSLFGQVVILLLIQLGGLGFMTFFSLFAMFLKKRISLRERMYLMQSSGAFELYDVSALIKRIVKGTLLFESLGAAILSIRFVELFGWIEGIYYGIFHSVSAFCNAGFDLFGQLSPFASLTPFQNDPLVLITVMVLIVVGGIGFLVWSDVLQHRHRLRRYSLHSKIVLTTTAALLLLGTLFFFVTEHNGVLAGMNTPTQLLNAAFQSVTLRTAGFDSLGQAGLGKATSVISCLFMLIGGSPASTAGGIKTVTVAVLLLTALSVIRGRKDVEVFGKRLNKDTVFQAFSVLFIYVCVLLSAVVLLSLTESFGLRALFFELSSAIGTVGLSFGITGSLTVFGKLVVTFIMFFGRIGGLSLAIALSGEQNTRLLRCPEASVIIG